MSEVEEGWGNVKNPGRIMCAGIKNAGVIIVLCLHKTCVFHR